MHSSKATQSNSRHNALETITRTALGVVLIGLLAACGGAGGAGGVGTSSGGGGASAVDLNGFWKITETGTADGTPYTDVYVSQIIQTPSQVTVVDNENHRISATLVGDTLGWRADTLQSVDGSVTSYDARVQATGSALENGTINGTWRDAQGSPSTFDGTLTATPLVVNVNLSNPLSRIFLGNKRPGNILGGNHQDLFSFKLSSPKRVHISASGQIDTVGILLDANGKVIGHNDNAIGETDFHITTDLAAGDYYIVVRGRDANVSGPYWVWINLL